MDFDLFVEKRCPLIVDRIYGHPWLWLPNGNIIFLFYKYVAKIRA